MLVQRQLLLAKIETAYGEDPTPVPETNAILTQPASVKIMARTLERNNVKPYFGPDAPVNVGDGVQVEFVTELKGHGSAGVAPEIGPLFRACNYAETIQVAGATAWAAEAVKTVGNKVNPSTPNGYFYQCSAAGTTGVTEPTWPTTEGQTVVDGTVTWQCKLAKVDYDPHSEIASAESITIYFYYDGKLRKALGCRGTFKIAGKAGDYVRITWTFTGLYAGPADEALVSGTYNQAIPPRFLSASFAIDSYAAIIENLALDGGNVVSPRSDVSHATGIREYFISDRKFTGSIDPEDVLNSVKDFESLWAASSRVAFTGAVGTATGNKCLITGPKVAFSGLDDGDRAGQRIKQIPLVFTPNTGNDEIKFSFQ